jgi:hypothetical protein
MGAGGQGGSVSIDGGPAPGDGAAGGQDGSAPHAHGGSGGSAPHSHGGSGGYADAGAESPDAAGAAGSAGAGCRAPACCTAGACLVDVAPGTTVTVTPLPASPALPDDMRPIAAPIAVAFDPGPAASATIAIRIAGADPRSLVLMTVAPGAEEARPVPATVAGDVITFTTRHPGAYVAAAVSEAPPAACQGKILPGDVSVATDGDLAALDGVTRLEGSLTVTGALTGWAPLRCLTAVAGGLSVSATTAATLELPALVRVGGRLLVRGGESLASVLLPRLRFVGADPSGSLTLEELPNVTKVELGRLVETPSGLRLARLGAATDAPASVSFAALARVGGAFAVDRVAHLPSFAGFANLRAVHGEVTIRDNAALASLDGLAALETVKGRLLVAGNYPLASIGLRSLSTVGAGAEGSIAFERLPLLTHVDLRALAETPGHFAIRNVGGCASSELTTILPALAAIRGDLVLVDNAHIHGVDGFAALTTVSGSFTVTSNPRLTSLVGLARLRSVGGSFTVTDNATLPTCAATGLRDRLGASGIGGTVTVAANLTDSCG